MKKYKALYALLGALIILTISAIVLATDITVQGNSNNYWGTESTASDSTTMTVDTSTGITIAHSIYVHHISSRSNNSGQ